MPNKKEYKLDIFKTLGHIRRKDRGFYSALTEEENKALQPMVVMRWLSGNNIPFEIILLNELVNPLVFPFTKHKELLYYLLTASAQTRSIRAKWLKAKPRSNKQLVKLVQRYFDYNERDAIDALKILTDKDILDICEDIGMQKDELKKIKVEIKAR